MLNNSNDYNLIQLTPFDYFVIADFNCKGIFAITWNLNLTIPNENCPWITPYTARLVRYKIIKLVFISY